MRTEKTGSFVKILVLCHFGLCAGQNDIYGSL